MAKCWPMCATMPSRIAQANQQAQLASCAPAEPWPSSACSAWKAWKARCRARKSRRHDAELPSLAAQEKSIAASLVAREALLAPVTGVVARAEVVAGQVVEARDVLFEVVDPARVLVEATTADAALPAASLGASCKAPACRCKLLGASQRTARRHAAADVSGAEPRVIQGPRWRIAAGGRPAGDRRRVGPRARQGHRGPAAQAVVRNAANEPVVWIKSGAERYIPQPVRISRWMRAAWWSHTGLGADNRVVVQGAPLIAQIR